MKKLLLVSAISVLAVGCSTFKTVQTDVSYEAFSDGTKIATYPSRSVTTKVTAKTLWDSQSALANFKASQTDKTQGASVGSLSQASSGTNAINVIEAAFRGFAQGVK